MAQPLQIQDNTGFIDLKMRNWHQKNIKSKWITFDAFFRVNEKTPEKLEYIRKHTKM